MSFSTRSRWISLHVAIVMILTAGALVPVARGDCCICEGANQNACTTIGTDCSQCAQVCGLSGFSELTCCVGDSCAAVVTDNGCTGSNDLCLQTATGFGACQGTCAGTAPSATPSNTPTDTQTNTPTHTPTQTPTNTPANTPTNTPTSTPTDTSTVTSTVTPTNTPVPIGGACST